MEQTVEEMLNDYVEKKKELEEVSVEVKALKLTESKVKTELEELKTVLQEKMLKENMTKARTEKGSATFMDAKISVVIDDLSLIPEAYIREKVTREPNKVKILEALSSGEEVSGAHTETGVKPLKVVLLKEGK